MISLEGVRRCGVRGSLRLGFAVAADGRTQLAERAHVPPLQVVRAFGLADGAALVHLHNVSGGVLGGDTLTLSVEVGPDAQTQLTTTSATRVYRPRQNDTLACQTLDVLVGENGLLEYLPDPLIPFARARYRQETRITLGPGAGLFWWETVTPGRSAFGEEFAYERLDLRLDLIGDGRLLARERVGLEPARRPLQSPTRLGPYRYFSTLYVCRVGVPATEWAALETQLSELAAEKCLPGEALWGVSTLPAHGLSVRALSVNGRDLAAGLTEFWRTAKQTLYGRDAIIPRKVY